MLLVDAGNTFIKWARPNPDQIFNPESVSWKNFGAVRHHELATLKSAWKKLTGRDKAEEKLSNQKAVNPQKSEANEIVELNKMLYELRDGIKNAAEDLERNMIAECSIELQEIMDLFNIFISFHHFQFYHLL